LNYKHLINDATPWQVLRNSEGRFGLLFAKTVDETATQDQDQGEEEGEEEEHVRCRIVAADCYYNYLRLPRKHLLYPRPKPDSW
jgi:hypothetical protein